MAFFPNNTDYGVLALPSFLVVGPNQLEFDEKVTSFLKNATEKGKKKIIVDLQGNGGGSIAAGLNMFKAFFPEKDVYSANRFRWNKGIELIGKALSSPKLPLLNYYTAGQPYNWKQNVKPDQEEGFDTFEEYFGPYDVLGVPSSALYANNLTQLSTPNYVPVSGYGEMPLAPKSQLFGAEDIILVRHPITFTFILLTVTAHRRLLRLNLHALHRTNEKPRSANNSLRRPPTRRPNAKHGRS